MILRSHTNPTKASNITNTFPSDLSTDEQSHVFSNTDTLPANPVNSKFSRDESDFNQLEAE